MKAKKRRNDFVDELETMLTPDRVERARKKAEKEIFNIRLAELRKMMKVRQEDIKTFTQSGISKLEKRKDMKISTLLEYLDSIGMGIEIKTFPKKTARNRDKDIILLRH
ncbi:MAG: XRE family transcriptional regulator [Spirochaetes bacterium]|nr:XRE family transcriptional regulator [Spirochaetota bacterium]